MSKVTCLLEQSYVLNRVIGCRGNTDSGGQNTQSPFLFVSLVLSQTILIDSKNFMNQFPRR